MLRPLVIGSGAAETVIPSDWFTTHKVEESPGSRSRVHYTTADGTPVHNEGEKTFIMCTPVGQHMRQMIPGGGRKQSAEIGGQDRAQ